MGLSITKTFFTGRIYKWLKRERKQRRKQLRKKPKRKRRKRRKSNYLTEVNKLEAIIARAMVAFFWPYTTLKMLSAEIRRFY
jgi:hypothetical protein